ncbi:hypothetical protein SNE40_012155 [Patella caerulea]|uniref:MYND-type domain-containing protein n=1 Tax=Patella caerulea TaxID=87958 RepID=A0AAN8JNJ4_PATCE
MNRKELLEPGKLAQFVDDYAKDHPEEFDKFSKEMVENMKNSKNRESEICKLPKEDTVWLIIEQAPEIVDGVKKRTLMMSDKKGAYLAVHLEDPNIESLPQQAYSLLCLACLYPLSGKSRRPKLVTFKDAEIARNTHLDLSKLKIKYINPDTISNRSEEDEELSYVRECCSCRTRGTPELFKTCSACEGFQYCSRKCQKNDWSKKGPMAPHSHKHWCKRIKVYMEKTDELATFPFTFTSETTAAGFHLEKYKSFLQQHGVYNDGLWRRECPLGLNLVNIHECPFGQLSSDDNPYILPVESSVLTSKPDKTAPPFHEPFQDWQSYYKWRGFPLNSPIAILLHFPLTLYYIITSCFIPDFPEKFSEIETSGNMTIHIVGVEKEVEMLMVFQELGYLIPSIKFDIHMVGIEIMSSLDGKREVYNNVSITVHQKPYHQYKGDNPDLVVGFNAGIGAYITWGETISKLKKEDIPSYFTDYCQYSCECARQAVASVGVTVEPTFINPFRNPVRKVCTENNMPWYSNGFIIKLTFTDINDIER